MACGITPVTVTWLVKTTQGGGAAVTLVTKTLTVIWSSSSAMDLCNGILQSTDLECQTTGLIMHTYKKIKP